ncbi:MAG: alpha/beta fold hydrolase [Selenomonadaceae bacterium]|nr:alpha/beta fold hydrolase [Selenomonadaceae bacterium]
MILPGAEPFLLSGGEQGVLLIHGFTGVPTELLMMGKYLNKRGCTVLGVRLAGHGTSVEDMCHMTHEDWMDSVRDGYALLSGLTEKIAVIGHSMGGLYALLLSTEVSVSHVVTLAAPIFIAEERGISALPPREIAVGQFVPKARRHLTGVPPVVNNTYRKMPLISVHELLEVIGQVKDSIAKVTSPVLIMHSRIDHTAAPQSAEYIYAHVKSLKKNIIWLENSGHLLPLDADRELVFQKATEFILA